MTALHGIATVAACPLGRPGRFSMTPAQQRVYRELAAMWRHTASREFFFDDAMAFIGMRKSNLCSRIADLIERGWAVKHGRGQYALTSPVMEFRACTEVAL